MHVALPTRVLSLFSGYGGLDLALEAACGARPVVLVERDAFAASVLVARMEEEAMAPAPIWDDVATFDGVPWRGVVDCVAGGSPCQGHSVAGKRAGFADERSALWTHQLRITSEARPAFAWWENVGGAIGTALELVTHDLEGLGFRVAACTLGASDVGAPHERQRLFVLAYSDSNRREGERLGGLPDSERAAQRNDADGRGGAVVANSAGIGRGQGRPKSESARLTVTDGACSRGLGAHQRRATTETTTGGLGPWSPQPFPPGPGSPRWSDWSGPQPCVRRGVDGAAARLDVAYSNDRLRLCGNGVVWQQAAAAFLVCWQRLFPGGA